MTHLSMISQVEICLICSWNSSMITFKNYFDSFPAVYKWYLLLSYLMVQPRKMEMSKHAWKIVDWDIKHHGVSLFGLGTHHKSYHITYISGSLIRSGQPLLSVCILLSVTDNYQYRVGEEETHTMQHLRSLLIISIKSDCESNSLLITMKALQQGHCNSTPVFAST